MRRSARRKHGSNDSFDLFLDTITNTFGGVLLLALLLVLMIRETSKVETAADTTESRSSLVETISQLETEKQNLLQAEAVRNSLQEDEDRDQSLAIANEIAELTSKEKELQEAEASLGENASDLNLQLKNASMTAEKIQAEIDTQSEALKIAQGKLASIQELRTRTMPTPKEKITRKPMTVVLVKGKRVFILDQNLGNGDFAVNKAHFTASSESAADILLLDGTALKTAATGGYPASPTSLEQEFNKVNKDYRITFAVWQDSFSEFSSIREACVKAGFEYQIVAIEKGPILETRGTGTSKAQ